MVWTVKLGKGNTYNTLIVSRDVKPNEDDKIFKKGDIVMLKIDDGISASSISGTIMAFSDRKIRILSDGVTKDYCYENIEEIDKI